MLLLVVQIDVANKLAYLSFRSRLDQCRELFIRWNGERFTTGCLRLILPGVSSFGITKKEGWHLVPVILTDEVKPKFKK